MAFASDELARRSSGDTEFREMPLRARWIIDGLTTADAHEARCEFQCSVRVASPASDRKLFVEVFLHASQSATIGIVEAHLAEALRAAAHHHALSSTAANLLSGQGNKEFIDALRKGVEARAFACGVEVIPPIHVALTSRTLSEEARRRAAGERASIRFADHGERVRRSAVLFRQFAAFRAEFPDVLPSRLLERFDPVDRGEVLHALLMSESAESSVGPLWAVAGTYLVRIDLGEEISEPKSLSLPPTLGPLRSVRAATLAGEPVLLVGARSGVFIVHPHRIDSATAYVDPDVKSDLGFNSAVVLEGAGQLMACHTEGGLVTWSFESPDRPTSGRRELVRTELKAGPRHLEALDRRSAAFAIGSTVVIVGRGDDIILPGVTSAPVIFIWRDEASLNVIHRDGSAYCASLSSLELGETRVFTGDYSAASVMPFLGAARLVLACEDGSVESVGLEDSLVTRYDSAFRGFRALASTAQKLVALTADRQRLVVWNSWDPMKPVREIHLGGITRHRVGDIAFQ